MNAPPSFQPRDADEIAAFLRERSQAAAPVRVRGGGGKSGFGRPLRADETVLDLAGLSGITLYEPGELVLSARAGTKLSEIEAAIAEHNQCLAFEPPEFGPLFGNDAVADIGRRRRLRLVGPTPDQGRRGARPCPGGVGHRRRGRGLQVRWPGGQERHRFRPAETSDRLAWDAGGDDRHHHQGSAGARSHQDHRGSRSGRRRRHPPAVRPARRPLRGLGRRSPACRRRAALDDRRDCQVRPAGHPDPAGRFRPLGRRPLCRPPGPLWPGAPGARSRQGRMRSSCGARSAMSPP